MWTPNKSYPKMGAWTIARRWLCPDCIKKGVYDPVKFPSYVVERGKLPRLSTAPQTKA